MRRLVYVLFAIVLLMFVPASFGSSSGSCSVCDGDYYDGYAFVFCTAPTDGEWGFSSCEVRCDARGSVGACSCVTSGSMCLYIVVNG